MLNQKIRKNPLAAAVTIALLDLIAVQPALAQVVEEVVVTAQKREENLQTTPLSISAMSGDSMEKLGITDFSGVVKASPALAFSPYPSSSNTLILYIRGQGVSDPMQITADGSVGLYSDGFYIARPQSSTFDLADVERVEVLRGPQGTLYGRNTTGGAVNLISKKPTGDFGFKQNLTFGTRDQFRSLTSINLPEVGGVATKFTLLKSDKDGYVKNIGNGHDFGEEAQQAGRFALNWGVTDDITVDYFMEMGALESTPIYYQNVALEGLGPIFNGFPGSYTNADGPRDKTYREFDLPLSKSDFEGHGLTVAWDVNKNLSINSLTGYRELSYRAYQDYAEAFLIGFETDDDIDTHQFSQEFQFVGTTLDDRLEYLVGLYYFEEKGAHRQQLDMTIYTPLIGPIAIPPIDIASDRNVSADAKSKAIFAQATWTPDMLDDRLSLTVGGRYTKDERSASRRFEQAGFLLEPGGSNDQEFSKFNPSFTANFNWNDDLSTYAKVVTGYKAGGSSESGPVGSFGMTFDPEEVTSYEVGMKSYWWDRRVRLNVAAYYSEFDDMQLAFVVDPTNSAVVQSQNAGSATVQGGEIELLVMPIDDLTFSLDVSLLDASFDEVEVLPGTVYDRNTNGASPYVVGDNIKDIFVMPYSPEKSVALGAEYVFYRFDQGDLTANLNYRWQDEQALTANAGGGVPDYKNYWQPSYGLLDARVTLSVDLPRGDKARIGLWGKNITDKEYRAHVTAQGGSVDTNVNGVLIPAGYATKAEAWAEPASFGIDIVYEY
jgi:iron complex outermembrane recepter protein